MNEKQITALRALYDYAKVFDNRLPFESSWGNCGVVESTEETLCNAVLSAFFSPDEFPPYESNIPMLLSRACVEFAAKPKEITAVADFIRAMIIHLIECNQREDGIEHDDADYDY